jgi:intracellular sulfur oxidation DsrE/DsrF family protein
MTSVIFHVDRFDDWGLVLTNVRNFLNEVPDAKIEVLANSSAVAFFAAPKLELEEQWQSLAEDGVDIVACNNALSGFGLTEDDLGPGVRIVPAGVVELAQKQDSGYGYIKP